MKISTQKLKSALASLSQVIKTRTTLPILQTIRMAAIGGVLEMKATSLDQYKILRIECDGKMEPCCVQISALMRQQFNADEMEMEVFSGCIKIKCGPLSVSLNTLPFDEFPQDPNPELMTQIGVPVADLARLLKQSVWACFDRDNSRYSLESVFVEGVGKSLRCSATNGHIGVRAESLVICADFKTTIHKDYAACVSECLSIEGAEFHVSSNWIKIAWTGGEYWCRVPESDFPIAGFKEVYSLIAVKIGDAPVEEIKRAMRSCLAIKPAEQNCGVILAFGDSGIKISFQGLGSDSCSTETGGKFTPWNQKMEAQLILDSLCKMDGPTCEVFRANRDAGLAFRQGDYTALIVGLGLGSKTP